MTIEQLEQGKEIQSEINQLLQHKKQVNGVGSVTYKPYLELTSGSSTYYGIRLYEDLQMVPTALFLTLYNTYLDKKISDLQQQLKDI